MSAAAAPERPTSGRRSSRGRWVLIVLVLAAAAGASSAGPWVRWWGTNALGDFAVTVSGATAAPVVPATALVLAAAGAAVALAGRIGRWVVVAVVALGGLALAGASGAVLVDPWNHVRDAVAAATGVDHVSDQAEATAWPWVAVVVGLLVVLAAVGLARGSAAWSAPDRRHEIDGAGPGERPARSPEAPAGGAPDERDDWDALTRGSDPSDQSSEGAGR